MLCTHAHAQRSLCRYRDDVNTPSTRYDLLRRQMERKEKWCEFLSSTIPRVCCHHPQFAMATAHNTKISHFRRGIELSRQRMGITSTLSNEHSSGSDNKENEPSNMPALETPGQVDSRRFSAYNNSKKSPPSPTKLMPGSSTSNLSVAGDASDNLAKRRKLSESSPYSSPSRPREIDVSSLRRPRNTKPTPNPGEASRQAALEKLNQHVDAAKTNPKPRALISQPLEGLTKGRGSGKKDRDTVLQERTLHSKLFTKPSSNTKKSSSIKEDQFVDPDYNPYKTLPKKNVSQAHSGSQARELAAESMRNHSSRPQRNATTWMKIEDFAKNQSPVEQAASPIDLEKLHSNILRYRSQIQDVVCKATREDGIRYMDAADADAWGFLSNRGCSPCPPLQEDFFAPRAALPAQATWQELESDFKNTASSYDVSQHYNDYDSLPIHVFHPPYSHLDEHFYPWSNDEYYFGDPHQITAQDLSQGQLFLEPNQVYPEAGLWPAVDRYPGEEAVDQASFNAELIYPLFQQPGSVFYAAEPFALTPVARKLL